MCSLFICGNFNHQENDDQLPCSPRKSRRHSKDSKNPYSTHGLDKFSALLAHLEEKKQQIYSQMDSQDVFLVRFAYSKSDDFVPIVVKLKEKKQQDKKKLDGTKDKPAVTNDSKILEPAVTNDSKILEPADREPAESNKKTTDQKKRFSWNMKPPCKWKRPSSYLPVIVILILLFLAFFGRSFAVLCTCLVWYIVPKLKGESPNVKMSTKKEQYARRLSENRRSFNPRTTNSMKDKSPPKLRHQKSWLR